MIVTLEELDEALDAIRVEEPDPPKIVGRCVIIPPDKRGPCFRKIYSDDIEAVQLLKPKEFCCGPCWDTLFHLKPERDLGEKTGPKKAGDHYRSAPRIPKGEDLG